MGKVTYHKLVRDRIPEIIEASGKTCSCRILPDSEYLEMLDEKLNEELSEYQEFYKKLRSVEREIKKIENDDSDKTARIDMLKFQIGEIEAAAIEEGEEDE